MLKKIIAIDDVFPKWGGAVVIIFAKL